MSGAVAPSGAARRELAGEAARKLRSGASTKRRSCSRYLNGNVIVYATSSQGTRTSQMTLNFDDEEKRQLESGVRSWRSRLEQFERELAPEPARIREFYKVRAQRVEPVGLVYLWPETN